MKKRNSLIFHLLFDLFHIQLVYQLQLHYNIIRYEVENVDSVEEEPNMLSTFHESDFEEKGDTPHQAKWNWGKSHLRPWHVKREGRTFRVKTTPMESSVTYCWCL